MSVQEKGMYTLQKKHKNGHQFKGIGAILGLLWVVPRRCKQHHNKFFISHFSIHRAKKMANNLNRGKIIIIKKIQKTKHLKKR